MRKMSSWAVYKNPLTFKLKSLMMKLNKSLLKLALRINYVSFLVTLTSIFLMLTHMSLLMISFISCIPMVSILLSLNQQGSRLIQLLGSITIFSNDLDNQKFSGILWSDISDHLPIF